MRGYSCTLAFHEIVLFVSYAGYKDSVYCPHKVSRWQLIGSLPHIILIAGVFLSVAEQNAEECEGGYGYKCIESKSPPTFDDVPGILELAEGSNRRALSRGFIYAPIPRNFCGLIAPSGE